MMRIAVLDDYLGIFRKLPCYARLTGHDVVVYHDTEKDPVKAAARLADADAVILSQQRSPFPRALIERLPRLKLIAQTGSNRDHIDLAACTERGILVCAVRYGPSHATVELTWALTLASLRNIPQEVAGLRKGVWQSTVGIGLHGNTLAVYGLGKIGQCVARIGSAFGMRISCWGQEASRARAREAGYDVPASREAFFETADVMSLHIRYKPETRGIITAADLARMKPTALIVNTSRGPLIRESVLIDALRSGRPGYAALDVFENEPLSGPEHPLLNMPNVTCTPHIGGLVHSTYENWYGTAIDAILGLEAGQPVNVINPEALRSG